MSAHLQEFEMALAQYLGAGVSAFYRGFRIYDTPATMAVVTKWVSMYKAYRAVVTSDIVHVRRPDGRAIDAFLHVNPALPDTVGLGLAFNPTGAALTQAVRWPLYFTGLQDAAVFCQEGKQPVLLTLGRDYSVVLNVTLAAQSVTWWAIYRPNATLGCSNI